MVTNQKKGQRWQDGVNILFGAWLFFSPLFGIGESTGVAAWNAYILGALVVLFSVWALAKPQPWEELVNLALGLWIILSPFLLNFTAETTVMWNHIIVGILIGGSALWAWIWTGGGQHPHARPTA